MPEDDQASLQLERQRGKRAVRMTLRRRSRRNSNSEGGWYDFWHLNGSGTPQISSLLDQIFAQTESRRKFAVLTVDEHQKRKQEFQLWRETMSRHGWYASGAPATTGSGGGSSAGVAAITLRGK